MMRNVKVVLTLAVLGLMVGCGGTDSPEKVVERCWEYLSEGDYAKAVELMDASLDERELYCSIFAEQSGELQKAGGVESFELLGSSVGAEEATIEAAVVLADGQRIEATYRLVHSSQGWLIAQ